MDVFENLRETLRTLNLQKIPSKITIDEAIEIAKKFGADDSAEFVKWIAG